MSLAFSDRNRPHAAPTNPHRARRGTKVPSHEHSACHTKPLVTAAVELLHPTLGVVDEVRFVEARFPPDRHRRRYE